MEINLSSVLGKPVYDEFAKKIGEVKDVVFNPTTGEIYLVISTTEGDKKVLASNTTIGDIVLLKNLGYVTCPNCGFQRVPPDARYCPRCGFPLETVSKEETAESES